MAEPDATHPGGAAQFGGSARTDTAPIAPIAPIENAAHIGDGSRSHGSGSDGAGGGAGGGTFQRRLQTLARPGGRPLLSAIRRGIEKENLRITRDGRLARTPHPHPLGSALTHPYITTDFSEALLEFITPVCTRIEDALQKLDDIQRFTYANIGGELLWAASMPCLLESDSDIPVARYGASNVAQMKTIYRRGLVHRYGALMQTIAGIHYNFSMPDDYWPLAQQEDGDNGPLGDYITTRYLGLIRNFRRHSWLLVYLFGASPAVCASFVRGGGGHNLQPFDAAAKSLHKPFGTSLRMGDLGYSSNAQNNLDVCYNSLDSYIETLRAAIVTPHPDYQAIGIVDGAVDDAVEGGVGGAVGGTVSGAAGGTVGSATDRGISGAADSASHWRQLNTSLLQIENEFYSPIRPKRVTRSGETPLGALRRDGIEYVEVRCIDLNPFLPLGIDAAEARFIDCFLLHCLLADSPPCNDADRDRLRVNMERVVNRGREPGLELLGANGPQPLTELAQPLLDATAALAEMMDDAQGDMAQGGNSQGNKARGGTGGTGRGGSSQSSTAYADSQRAQVAKVADPALTPSARVLREMAEQGLSFFHLAMQHSEKWAEHYRQQPLATDKRAHFEQACAESHARQAQIEAADEMGLEDYLRRYYQQYDELLVRDHQHR